MARSRIAHEVDTAVIEERAKNEQTKIFAQTLNTLLSEKNIHQDDFATAVGLSVGIISQYRRGIKEPKMCALIKMADYLGVDCQYLMTGVKAENAAIASELGLSDGAIKMIRHEIADGKKEALNAVLENYFFNHWLGIIKEYSDAPSYEDEIFDRSRNDRFPNHLSKEITEALSMYWASKLVGEVVKTINEKRHKSKERVDKV